MTPAELSGKKGQALGLIAREYEKITCRTVSRAVINDSEYFIDQGVEPEVVVHALEITKEKGADWNYTKAILERLVSEGIFKLDIWEDRVRFRKIMNELKKQCPYSTEEELLPFAIIRAYRHTVDDMEEWIKEHENVPFNLDDICDPD